MSLCNVLNCKRGATVTTVDAHIALGLFIKMDGNPSTTLCAWLAIIVTWLPTSRGAGMTHGHP
jgi:hypothetical protein